MPLSPPHSRRSGAWNGGMRGGLAPAQRSQPVAPTTGFFVTSRWPPVSFDHGQAVYLSGSSGSEINRDAQRASETSQTFEKMPELAVIKPLTDRCSVHLDIRALCLS